MIFHVHHVASTRISKPCVLDVLVSNQLPRFIGRSGFFYMLCKICLLRVIVSLYKFLQFVSGVVMNKHM